jgi:hypothetical protein
LPGLHRGFNRAVNCNFEGLPTGRCQPKRVCHESFGRSAGMKEKKAPNIVDPRRSRSLVDGELVNLASDDSHRANTQPSRGCRSCRIRPDRHSVADRLENSPMSRRNCSRRLPRWHARTWNVPIRVHDQVRMWRRPNSRRAARRWPKARMRAYLHAHVLANNRDQCGHSRK